MPSKIEWTDETWNPTIGCSKVSAGCDHCYAIGVVHRAMQPAHAGLTVKQEGSPTDWTGEVRYVPERLDQPLRWKRPRKIFVNSLSDMFHPEVLKLTAEDRFGTSWPVLAEIVAVMVRADQHIFQVLTKRPQIMAAVLNEPWFRMDVNAILLRDGHPVMPGGFETPWPAHIWWGTSIDEDRYAFRADRLRATPAAVRFLSLEPLLGPLPSLDLTHIDWVIVGGESGPGARPMHPAWVTDLRDRCLTHPCERCDGGRLLGQTRGRCACSNVPLGSTARPGQRPIPFLFKQWGAYAPHIGHIPQEPPPDLIVMTEDGRWEPYESYRHGAITRWDRPAIGGHGEAILVKGPKNRRELDGRTWDEYPGDSGG